MTPKKEALIHQRLKKEDQFELPMDDTFFDQLHDKIMKAIDDTEVEKMNRWDRAKVFLESKSRLYRSTKD